MNTTGHGHTCQAWGSSTPHTHSRLPSAYPTAGLAQNFCRNPDNGDRVWCYTIDGPRRQYCDVPLCTDTLENVAATSAQDEGLLLEMQAVTVHTKSSAGALSDHARVTIIAGASAIACSLLQMVALGLLCCYKQKRKSSKPNYGAVYDPANCKAYFQTAQAAVNETQDSTLHPAQSNISTHSNPWTQLGGASGESSCDYSQRLGTTVSPKVPVNMGTARLPTYTGTVSQDTSVSIVRPGPSSSTSEKQAYLDFQLDSLKGVQVLRRLAVLDKVSNRRHGGQAVVQIAEDMKTHVHHAMKFFLSDKAFRDEIALYEDPTQPLGQFLPEIHSIVKSGTLVDAQGVPLPPCIVMEKGESLDLWAASTGDGLDMVTGLQVLTHVADRLKDLHEAGYVHRDIKPGNVLWLPRKKRWTLIDFGCVARTGEEARAGFTLNYAAPEAVQAQWEGAQNTVATEALDAWSVGILAIEIFTGQPVFDAFESKLSKAEMIIGEKVAPWEDEAKATILAKRFGHLKGPVLALLDRNPAARPSMAALQYACHSVLSNSTTHQTLHELCESVGSHNADTMLCVPPIQYDTVEGGVSFFDSTESSVTRERGAQTGVKHEQQHPGSDTTFASATEGNDTDT